MPSPGRLLYLFRRDLARGLCASYHFYRTLPKIAGRKPSSDLPLHPSGLPIHVLTGEENWLLTAWMLASFEVATGFRWTARIHDDGTLSKANADCLAKLFPDSEVVFRSETDAQMEELLAPYPRCLEYRQTHPLALKCFDVIHLVEHERFLLFDSDVLFFDRPQEILDWIDDPSSDESWFNGDPQEPSPVLPQDAERVFGGPLWPKVNSGLCLLRKDLLDLEYMEHCLAVPELEGADPWRLEQMLLGLCSAKIGGGGLLPSRYEVSLGRDRQPDSIARHYVGAVRHHFYREGIAGLASFILR